MSERISKRRIATLTRQIEHLKVSIAADRDKLRDLVSDAEDLLSSCDEADESLNAAIDALSKLV